MDKASEGSRESEAQRAADRLALALEEVGFDVGRVFPSLRGMLDHHDAPTVELGRIDASQAGHLSDVLMRAAQSGITL